MKSILFILLCVFLTSIAQIFLKFGMNKINMGNVFNLLYVIKSPYIIFGGTLYVTSFFIWLYVLSQVKVSYAVPFMSLSYLTVAILAFFLLSERISYTAWIGICLVVVGLCLIGISIES